MESRNKTRNQIREGYNKEKVDDSQLASYQKLVRSGKKVTNSFGELGPKREVVLNVFKGPESDYGGSKIRKDS